MHNKRIINDVWWALLHEGVPVRKSTTNYLVVDSEYINGACVLTSDNFIWLSPMKDTEEFYTEPRVVFRVNEEIDPEKLFEAVRALGEYWAEWSSERNLNVSTAYLQDRMRECICDILNERGVPAKLYNCGRGICVHRCTLVSYESCFFHLGDWVESKEKVATVSDKLIDLRREYMDTILSSLVDFAERYAALPSEAHADPMELSVNTETMSDTVARLDKTLDDGFNYRSACAKCLVAISKGLEANPDDTKLWHLHSKFVNSMKEIE